MVATKERTLDKAEALTVVNGFLSQFQNCCNQHKTPQQADFQKYLAANFQISSNGRLAAKNLKDYLSRIETFQKRYTHCEVSVINEECIAADDKLIIRYNVNLITQSQQKIQMNIMALAVFEDHIITRWSQVAHQRGAGNQDF